MKYFSEKLDEDAKIREDENDRMSEQFRLLNGSIDKMSNAVAESKDQYKSMTDNVIQTNRSIENTLLILISKLE